MVYWLDFVYSPPGFYGKDILIDSLSAVVLMLIAFFSYKNYKLNQENKKHLLMSLAFFMLGCSFIAKIATNWLVHADSYGKGVLIPALNIFPQYNAYSAISALGFLAYAFLTVYGFYLLYALSSREHLTMNYVIIAYLIFISIYYSRFNYTIFYITGIIFLAALARRYILQYLRFKYRNTLHLGISFAIIAFSQLAFIFTSQDRALYIAAEIIQLIGYLYLLYTFIMVLANARKKKQD